MGPLPREARLTPAVLIVAAAWALAAQPALAQPRDLTRHLEWLGNPGKLTYPSDDKAFARNVWDLKAFEGRLYVGLGNRNNIGPAPNAGPVDIWYYSRQQKRFVKEWTAPDEQIRDFRVIGGQLIVPGNDPTESWELGNFYRLEKGGWEKIRALPNGLHNFDMIEFAGVLYAALGTESGAVVAASRDRGQTWREYRLRPNTGNYPARAQAFFVVGGRLYVSSTGQEGSRTHVLAGDSFEQDQENDFFPGARRRNIAVHAYTAFAGKAVYLGAQKIVGRHEIPIALFVAGGVDSVQMIKLPANAIPRDITVDGGRVLVLATEKIGASHLNYVFESVDLAGWTERARFQAPAFARAFEVLGGDFYFGLGSDDDDVRPETGEILRLPAKVL